MTLPPGWKAVALSDLGTWYGGGTPSKAREDFWTGGSTPWLSPKDMGPEVVHATQDLISDAAVTGSSVRLVPAGSIAVVVRSGILERTIPIALVQMQTTLNQDMKAVVPRDDIDPRWIAWGLRAKERHLMDHCRKAGTTVASIDTKRFMAETLLVPPIDVQRRIVDLLEDHLSRLDAAVANTEMARQRLAALERSSIDAVFSRVAEQSRWPVGRLDDLAAAEPRAITDGPFGSNLASRHYTPSGARVIRLQNIGDAEFKDADAFISLDHYAKLQAHNVQAGDVVVASLGDALPRAAVVPGLSGPAIVKADCIRVRPRADVDPRWIAYGCRSSAVKHWAADQLHGVGRQRLGLAGVRAVPLPIPSPGDMRSWCDQIDAQLQAAGGLRHELAALGSHVGGLRRSLLAAAFAGQF